MKMKTIFFLKQLWITSFKKDDLYCMNLQTFKKNFETQNKDTIMCLELRGLPIIIEKKKTGSYFFKIEVFFLNLH